MTRPADIPVIDTMIGFKDPVRGHYIPPNVRGDRSGKAHAASYMFTEVPDEDDVIDDDVVADTLSAMDANGVSVAMVGIGDAALWAAERYPGRFVLATHVDPNGGAAAIRQIRSDHREHGIRAVTMFPAGSDPQVTVADPAAYGIYATCVDLDLPIFVNAGVPGPRVPMHPQHVQHFDQVCYDFPDLQIVMRHGAEPWADLAVKLMLRWPNLHYSTSAFAPRYYPQAIIDFANTRGTAQVLYAGYFPFALTLERIMAELNDVPFRDQVWRPFLHDNAVRLLGLVTSP